MPDTTREWEPLIDGIPIATQVFMRLRDRIVAMGFEPGERLSEVEVSRVFEVSRQPVREAFIKLSDIGLLAIRPQRGTFVQRISSSAVRDAQFVRQAVEGEIVKAVAARATPQQVAELRGQIARQRAVTAGEAGAFMQLDEAFHQTLARIADRRAVLKLIQDSKLQMDRVRHLSLQQFPLGKLVDQHAAVVDAIAAADPRAARTAMTRHLSQILKDLPQIEQDWPDFFMA